MEVQEIKEVQEEKDEEGGIGCWGLGHARQGWFARRICENATMVTKGA